MKIESSIMNCVPVTQPQQLSVITNLIHLYPTHPPTLKIILKQISERYNFICNFISKK